MPLRFTGNRTVLLYLAVGTGAALGSLVRFLTATLFVSALGLGPLVATGFVNAAGSFVIGGFATLSGPDGRLLIGTIGRQFVMAGLCGGLTTFSSMSLDTLIELLDGNPRVAAVYLVSVVALSLISAWLGHALAARINR